MQAEDDTHKGSTGITQDQWDAARQQFSALSTETTEPGPSMDLLTKALVYIPGVMDRVRALADGWVPGSLEHWARLTPVAVHAFDYAAVALNVAADGLGAVYGQIVVASSLPAHAMFTLARQAAEAALRARWLLGDLSPEQLITRGFAAAFEDFKATQKFVDESIAYGLMTPQQGRDERHRLSERRSHLMEEGRAHGLIHRPKQPTDLRPRVTVPDVKKLFEDAVGPRGPMGNTDMRWMYSLMSGVAHGRAWATMSTTATSVVREYLRYSDDGSAAASGIVVAKSDPHTTFIAMAVMTGAICTLDALSKFDSTRSTPAPSVTH